MRGNITQKQAGFTIVELLIVIVVIAILAAITIIAYNGIQSRATSSSLQSQLSSAAKALEVSKATSSSAQYPNSASGLSFDTSTQVTYIANNSVSQVYYCLTATKNSISYHISPSEGAPTTGTCSDVTITSPVTGQVNFDSAYGYTAKQPRYCPPGFIPVPGSTLYGKPNGFCVMKYEAKQASSTVPVSVAAGTPWVSIPNPDAATYSANIVGCSGCRLISDAEWMTLAHNVLRQTSNWSTGTVGSGYIYSGHNDGTPNNGLAASTDGDGYSGTGNVSGNQRRTLNLSNGEVVWDIAGNLYEWTTGHGTVQIGAAGYLWREWSAVSNASLLSPNPAPGVAASFASSLSGTNGIGRVNSNTSLTDDSYYARGGRWTVGDSAGIFSFLQGLSISGDANIGFRSAF